MHCKCIEYTIIYYSCDDNNYYMLVITNFNNL